MQDESTYLHLCSFQEMGHAELAEAKHGNFYSLLASFNIIQALIILNPLMLLAFSTESSQFDRVDRFNAADKYFLSRKICTRETSGPSNAYQQE